MKKNTKDNFVKLHLALDSNDLNLTEQSILNYLTKLKSTDDRYKYLIETKLKVQFCILEIETKRNDLIYDFLLKENLDIQINQDVYDYLSTVMNSYILFKGGLDIIEINLSTNKSKKNYKFIRKYVYVKDGVDVEYIIIDNEKNREILKNINLNLDLFLNNLKKYLLPRIDLEIQKNQLESINSSHKSFDAQNINYQEIPNNPEFENTLNKKSFKVNLKKETEDYFHLVSSKDPDKIFTKYFVSEAKKELTASINSEHNFKLTRGNKESIRSYLSKLKRSFINSKRQS